MASQKHVQVCHAGGVVAGHANVHCTRSVQLLFGIDLLREMRYNPNHSLIIKLKLVHEIYLHRNGRQRPVISNQGTNGTDSEQKNSIRSNG